MAKFETFDRDIKVATAGLSQEAISAELARFAKAELARVIESGEGNANYTRFVNGQEGAREETVNAPGPILYQFAWWSEVIEFALAELIRRSPKRSGKYIRSFVVVVGGRVPVTSYENIRGDAEVIIFNAQPYTRRIETGSMSFSVPPFHFETATGALRRRFGARGSFRFETRFVNVPSGIHPLAPYRLKRTAGRGRGKQAGAALTYPAIVMNMVH